MAFGKRVKTRTKRRCNGDFLRRMPDWRRVRRRRFIQWSPSHDKYACKHHGLAVLSARQGSFYLERVSGKDTWYVQQADTGACVPAKFDKCKMATAPWIGELIWATLKPMIKIGFALGKRQVVWCVCNDMPERLIGNFQRAVLCFNGWISLMAWH